MLDVRQESAGPEGRRIRPQWAADESWTRRYLHDWFMITTTCGAMNTLSGVFMKRPGQERSGSSGAVATGQGGESPQ